MPTSHNICDVWGGYLIPGPSPDPCLMPRQESLQKRSAAAKGDPTCVAGLRERCAARAAAFVASLLRFERINSAACRSRLPCEVPTADCCTLRCAALLLLLPAFMLLLLSPLTPLLPTLSSTRDTMELSKLSAALRSSMVLR